MTGTKRFGLVIFITQRAEAEFAQQCFAFAIQDRRLGEMPDAAMTSQPSAAR
jgi:hypothetical protein